MSGARLPVRIEIRHLVTDQPAWIQEWNGAGFNAHLLPHRQHG